MMEVMKAQLAREAVRYAVQRAMFCPDCGGILDMDKAVLSTTSGRAEIRCGACFDKRITKAARRTGLTFNEFVREMARDGVTIDDGRMLVKRLAHEEAC